MRYQSQPTEIEAIQWTGDNAEEVHDFGAHTLPNGDEVTVVIHNPEDGMSLLAGKDGAQGYVPVPVGHWIVRSPGDYTDHWPVDPTYFAAKYEPAAAAV